MLICVTWKKENNICLLIFTVGLFFKINKIGCVIWKTWYSTDYVALVKSYSNWSYSTVINCFTSHDFTLYIFFLAMMDYFIHLFLGMVAMYCSYSMPTPPTDFNADHPFLFYLASNATCQKNVLFSGRMMKPATQ